MKKQKKNKVGSKKWWEERLTLAYGVIPEAMVTDILGKGEAKKFWKWMRGQTMSMHGIYPHDLKYYMEQKIRGVKGEPHCWD